MICEMIGEGTVGLNTSLAIARDRLGISELANNLISLS